MKFWHDIKEGDIIVARAGRKNMASIGRVTGTAVYQRNKALERGGLPGDPLTSLIPVRWEVTEEHEFHDTVFGLQTVTRPHKRSAQVEAALKELVLQSQIKRR